MSSACCAMMDAGYEFADHVLVDGIPTCLLGFGLVGFLFTVQC